MRLTALAAILLLCSAGRAGAQAAEGDHETWSFYASAYTYLVPDDDDYLQPTFAADRGWLHLEGRVNYEDLDTGSAWIGYNLSVGDELALEITPMLGVVFGNTTGIAPGYKGSLGWRWLELYSESEYVVDTEESDESFLYTWSELTVAPADWWRGGLVVQRTKVYDTAFDIQRGLLAGVTLGRVDLTAYVLNPDEDTTVVLAVGVGF